MPSVEPEDVRDAQDPGLAALVRTGVGDLVNGFRGEEGFHGTDEGHAQRGWQNQLEGRQVQRNEERRDAGHFPGGGSLVGDVRNDEVGEDVARTYCPPLQFFH